MLYNPEAQKASYATSRICADIIELVTNGRYTFHVLSEQEENHQYDALMFIDGTSECHTVDFKHHKRLSEFANSLTVPYSSLKHRNSFIIQYNDDYSYITIISLLNINIDELEKQVRWQKCEKGTFRIEYVKIPDARVEHIKLSKEVLRILKTQP